MQVPNPTLILEPPVVLIAGAGIGGLTVALICERANINYKLFERAAKVKPLGKRVRVRVRDKCSFLRHGSQRLNFTF